MVSPALQMQTMQAQRVIDVLPLASVLFVVVILYLGNVRSKHLSHGPLLRLNIGLWLRVHVNSFGFVLYLMSWVSQ